MSQMIRVTKAHRCPACNSDSWCLLGVDAALCMRVASDRPHMMKDGSVGYLHPMDLKMPLPRPVRKSEPAKELKVADTLQQWRRTAAGNRPVDDLARRLGVSADSLRMVGCVQSDRVDVYGWPMRDGHNNYTGIRLRHINGRKWSVNGSHPGLFLPQCEAQQEALIVEGGTDAAAGLTMGIFTIGRPSCRGGVNDLIIAIKRLKIRRVTIVADCDDDKVHRLTGKVWNPGIEGARGLADLLPVDSRIVTLPTKDLQQFVKRGGTMALFNSIASQLVWNKPK